MGLQIALGWWITKCVRYWITKVWQNGLQSALGITKCGSVDYKVHHGLQSLARLQSELVQYMYLKYLEALTYILLMTKVMFLQKTMAIE